MRICGFDFSSAPSKQKPIMMAQCRLEGQLLLLERVQALETLADFEAVLNSQGWGVAGIDAPFGQARKLLENLALGQDWESYVRAFAELGKTAFCELLTSYKRSRPEGDKEHKRQVDVLADALSPMKLYGVPVAKMFFELAPRLAKTALHLPVLRPGLSAQTVLEAYPALVARFLIGKRVYKTDHRAKQSAEQQQARLQLIQGLASASIWESYGLSLELSPEQQHLLAADTKADSLDALLAAVQAAWAFLHKDQNYGLPLEADPLEGWIADPSLQKI